MRWYMIDKITEFVHGQRAKAIKNVTMGEEQMQENPPGYPIYPHSLVVEGLAQIGGLLVHEVHGFRERVVLAKISKVKFHRFATPGDTMIYTTEIDDINEHGAFSKGWVHVDDELMAEMDLVFALVNEPRFEQPFFHPADFLAMLRTYGLFDVAVTPQGERISPPEYLLNAERASNGVSLENSGT